MYFLPVELVVVVCFVLTKHSSVIVNSAFSVFKAFIVVDVRRTVLVDAYAMPFVFCTNISAYSSGNAILYKDAIDSIAAAYISNSRSTCLTVDLNSLTLF